VQNISCKNAFYLRENKPSGGTYFPKTRFNTKEKQDKTKIACYITRALRSSSFCLFLLQAVHNLFFRLRACARMRNLFINPVPVKFLE